MTAWLWRDGSLNSPAFFGFVALFAAWIVGAHVHFWMQARRKECVSPSVRASGKALRPHAGTDGSEVQR